jgi:peptidoglycan/LPS O-acetylase OafA/YrhL
LKLYGLIAYYAAIFKIIALRITTIDCLRGIAALSVCFFHFCHFAVNVEYLPEGNWLKAISRFGTLGVELFFTISGFVIPYSMIKNNYTLRAFPSFIARRSLRIDLPYFVMIILSAIYTYFINREVGNKEAFNLQQFLLHFVYLPPFFRYKWYLGVFWTLLIEFQFYILIALVLPLLMKASTPLKMFMLIALQSIHFLFPDKHLITSHLSFFVIGISACFYKQEIFKQYETIALVLISMVFGYFHGTEFYNNPIAMSIVAGLSFIFITFVQLKNKVLLWLGKISYSLYLTHMLMVYLLFTGPTLYTISQSESIRILVTLAGVGVSVSVAYVFYIVVEKYSLKLAQKISYTSRSIKQAD